MFIYMLLSCRRKSQTEEIYKHFRSEFDELVRDCVVRDSGPRELDLIFKAEDYRTFISFAQQMCRPDDFVKSPVEFAYDDGSFRFVFVEADRITEERDRDHSNEYIHLPVLTGIQDNTNRAIKVWAAEVQATDEEIAAKKARIEAGQRAWDERMERDLERTRRREASKAASPTPPASGESPPPPTVKYSLPPNLSKARVLEFIQKLNASGEVIIPVFILREEIDKRLTKEQMLQLHLDLERSAYKSEIFQVLKRAVTDLRG
jgi:hypothetical protein